MTSERLFEKIITEARRRQGIKPYIPNAKLVEDWWPKPKIILTKNKHWPKYTCYSFSTIGFHPRDPIVKGVPEGECMVYGDTPSEAYNKWCEIFNVWNKKEEWVVK